MCGAPLTSKPFLTYSCKKIAARALPDKTHSIKLKTKVFI